RVFEIGEPQVAEHLLDDLRHAHVLEDAAVGGTAEQPQPGPQGDPISRELATVDALPASGDDAVEMPFTAAMLLYGERQRLAEQLVEIEVGIVGHQLQLVLEQTAQFVAAV